MAPLPRKALFLFPALLGASVVAFFIAFVPYNPSAEALDTLTARGLFVAYFAVGSILGTTPIIRSQSLTIGWKWLAVIGYVFGALFVLCFFLVIAFATRIVI